MKKLITLLLLATTLQAAPFNQTAPLPGVPAQATLAQAEAKVEQGNLVITLKSADTTITDWIHIFSNTGNSVDYYEHSSGMPAGKGLKMMIEGDIAYQFSGSSSIAWTWTPIPDTRVTRTISGNTMTISLPVAHLGFVPGIPVHFFAAAYSPDYANTLDTLPRGNEFWSFRLPAR